MKRRPGNRVNARSEPRGIPRIEPASSAVPVTRMVRPTISHNASSDNYSLSLLLVLPLSTVQPRELEVGRGGKGWRSHPLPPRHLVPLSAFASSTGSPFHTERGEGGGGGKQPA